MSLNKQQVGANIMINEVTSQKKYNPDCQYLILNSALPNRNQTSEYVYGIKTSLRKNRNTMDE
jgi:hypothetical protein